MKNEKMMNKLSEYQLEYYQGFNLPSFCQESVNDLPFSEREKSVLKDLFIPQNSYYYHSQINLQLNSTERDLPQKRLDMWSYPPFVISAEQVGLWHYALLWMIKKLWNSKQRIPVPAESSLMEPLGDLLCSVMRIIEYFKLHVSPYNTGNSTALALFYPIALEIYTLHITSPESGGKEVKAKEFSSYAYDIRANENLIDLERYPCLFAFIERVVNFSEPDKTNSFKREFLTKKTPKGLVSALESLAVLIRTDKRYQIVDVSTDSLKYNSGKGHNVLTQTKASLKKSAKSSFKKIMPEDYTQ